MGAETRPEKRAETPQFEGVAPHLQETAQTAVLLHDLACYPCTAHVPCGFSEKDWGTPINQRWLDGAADFLLKFSSGVESPDKIVGSLITMKDESKRDIGRRRSN